MENVLIIQLGRMGDCTQTLPLLKALREQKPKAFVTLLCVREFSEVFSRSSFIDRFVYLTASEVKTLKEKKQYPDIAELHLKYDFLLNLTNNEIGAFLSRNLNGEIKSGLVESPYPEGTVKGDWPKYLYCSQKSRGANLFNLVDMQMQMAGLSPAPVRDYMSVAPREIDHARELLKACGYSGEGRLIAFQLGANQSHRAWPVQAFVSLAQALVESSGTCIVLLGSKAESNLGDLFREFPEDRLINLLGKTAMSDLPAILKHCDFLVSNDTGTIHIAAAVNTRALGIYFSTAYFAETAPYGEGHTIVQSELPCSPCNLTDMCGEMPCRDSITVDIVARAARILLDNTKAPEIDSPSVSIYQSSFLSNGTLIYAPVSPSPVTPRFIEALIWHTGWERVFGIKPDEAFLANCLSRIDRTSDISLRLTGIKRELTGLCEKYIQAISLSKQIEAEFAAPSPDNARIAGISGKLSDLDQRITSFAHPLIKYYHMLEMTDIDYADYRSAIHQVGRSYAKLNTIVLSLIQGCSYIEDLLPK